MLWLLQSSFYIRNAFPYDTKCISVWCLHQRKPYDWFGRKTSRRKTTNEIHIHSNVAVNGNFVHSFDCPRFIRIEFTQVIWCNTWVFYMAHVDKVCSWYIIELSIVPCWHMLYSNTRDMIWDQLNTRCLIFSLFFHDNLSKCSKPYHENTAIVWVASWWQKTLETYWNLAWSTFHISPLSNILDMFLWRDNQHCICNYHWHNLRDIRNCQQTDMVNSWVNVMEVLECNIPCTSDHCREFLFVVIHILIQLNYYFKLGLVYTRPSFKILRNTVITREVWFPFEPHKSQTWLLHVINVAMMFFYA